MPSGIKKQHTGGVVDDSLLESTRLKIRELGGPCDLEERISRELGRYRDYAKFRDTEPTAAQTLKHLDGTVALANKLLQHIDLMPAIVDGLLYEKLQRANIAFNIEDELYRCVALYGGIAAELKTCERRKGEKPKTIEISLLSDVAALIEKIPGITVTKAAEYAAEILTLERVPYLARSKRSAPGAAREIVRNHRNCTEPLKNIPE